MSDTASRGSWAINGLTIALIIVILANLLSRLSLGVIVGDQAEMVVYAQDWRVAYDEQMPVYQWGMNILLRLTDYWVLTSDLVKYVWVIIAIICLYRLGARMSNKPIGGVLTVLLAFLIPTMNEDMLREYTHSAALIAFTAASALYFVKAGGERPRFDRWSPGLAILWGAGLMSKHSMALFIAAQCLAFLWVYRPAFREIRSLIMTGVVTLLALSPIYAGIVLNLRVVGEGAEEFLGKTGPLARVEGLIDMAGSIPAEGILLFLACFIAHRFARKVPVERLDLNSRFLFRLNGIVIAIFALGVIVANATVFRDRWLAPSLVLLAPIAARWFVVGLTRRTLGVMTSVLLIIFTVSGVERALEPYLNRYSGKVEGENLPLMTIAREVSLRLEAGDVVVGPNQAVMANIKKHRPDVAVYSPWTIENLPDQVGEVLFVTTQRPSRKPLDFPTDAWACDRPHEFYVPYHLVTEGTFRFELRTCRRG